MWPEIKTEFLFKMVLELPPELTVNLGTTPLGGRIIQTVPGGVFEGPRIKGRTLPGGAADWMLVRGDGSFGLEVRLTLETDDQQLIYMTYDGYYHGPKELEPDFAAGKAVDPNLYYFRTTPYFETGSKKYDWLNRICSVATGMRTSHGPTYHVYQVL